jgi:hypothetical protein
MNERQHIYIGEVYCNGQRVEQIAHTTHEGAQEDVEVSASGYDGDVKTEIHKRRLYGGPDGRVSAIETNRGP